MALLQERHLYCINMLQQVDAFRLRSVCFRPSSPLQHDHGDDHHDEDDDEHGDEDDGEDADPVRQLALHGSEGKHFEGETTFSTELQTTNTLLSDGGKGYLAPKERE